MSGIIQSLSFKVLLVKTTFSFNCSDKKESSKAEKNFKIEKLIKILEIKHLQKIINKTQERITAITAKANQLDTAIRDLVKQLELILIKENKIKKEAAEPTMIKNVIEMEQKLEEAIDPIIIKEEWERIEITEEITTSRKNCTLSEYMRAEKAAEICKKITLERKKLSLKIAEQNLLNSDIETVALEIEEKQQELNRIKESTEN